MNTTPTERKKNFELSLRQLLESLPVAGPILNNIFFEFRGQVRQDRINHFVSMLEEEFSKMNIDPTTLQTEGNLDLFESIFKKVADIRMENKREGLKNILMYGIQNPKEIEYCELFATLLWKIRWP